jgi:hypothetical protein
MRAYNPADFCSKPGITIDELRTEKANQLRSYIGYVQQILTDAAKMGLVGESDDEQINELLDSLVSVLPAEIDLVDDNGRVY